jgi:hypothetical protein
MAFSQIFEWQKYDLDSSGEVSVFYRAVILCLTPVFGNPEFALQ